MRLDEALTSCADTVRRHDPDRYFAALFAPWEKRPLLFALYAFNYEIARLGERNREPMAAAIRLQWWREAVEEAANGRPRSQPAAVGLAELIAKSSPPLELFSALLNAREFDFAGDAFGNLSELESYCTGTSSVLMKIAARVLGERADDFLEHAGIAYALAGLLRSLAFHTVRRRLYLPLEILAAEGLSPEAVFARKNGGAVGRVLRRLVNRAREHLAQANLASPRTGAFVAALPAALVSLYLKPLMRAGFDPFGQQIEVPVYRRQVSLLRATLLKKL
jgi:phytoene synthase